VVVVVPSVKMVTATSTESFLVVSITGAVLPMKPEATAKGNIARWPLENNVNV